MAFCACLQPLLFALRNVKYISSDANFQINDVPVHPVSPLFAQPAGHSSHVRLPGVFVHLRLLSHPPLSLLHSSTSESVVAIACMCLLATIIVFITYVIKYISFDTNYKTNNVPVHPVSPLFVHPAAQIPHMRPLMVLAHLRLLWHPPLFV